MAGIAKLIVIDGSLKGHEFPLQGSVTSLGRLADNHVVLDEPSVSRNHARVEVRDGGFILRDLGSYNGTYVGGNRIESAALRPGDTFRMGDISVQLVVEMPMASAGAEASPEVDPIAGGMPAVQPYRPSPSPQPGQPFQPGQLPQQMGQSLQPDQALQPGQPGQPAEMMPQPPETPESSSGPHRLIAASAVALLLAGVVALVYLWGSEAPATQSVLMKEGENRLVETALEADNALVVADSAVSKSDAVEASIYRSTGNIVLLHARGEAPSGVEVTLKKGDAVVETLTVVVKGHVEAPSGKYRGDMTIAEKVRLAERLVEEGNATRPTQLYDALCKYREAMAVTGDAPYKPAVWGEAARLAKETEADIKAEYDHHRFVVRSAGMMRDYQLAAKELQAIARLIPDPYDLRYQEARIYFERVKRSGVLK